MGAAGTSLTPDQGRLLASAASLALERLGGDAALVDEGDQVSTGRLARIGETLALVERPANKAANKFHRITAYLTEPGKRFKLDPNCALFVLHETHFAKPPDWNLQLVRDPGQWLGLVSVMLRNALM